MRLQFLVVDPDTDGDKCPALHVDEATGDLVFTGETVTDPGDLAQVEANSGVAPKETVIRVPARMRKLILEALRDEGTDVR